MAPQFHILHPGARAAVGAVGALAALAFGVQLFVDFSDASALQRAAGPSGTELGAAGLVHATARTGRAWPDRAAARRLAGVPASPPVAAAAPAVERVATNAP